MSVFATLGTILNNAYILYSFGLGIWAGVQFVRNQNLAASSGEPCGSRRRWA